MFRHIILRRIDVPRKTDRDHSFQWLIDSMGLQSGRDTQQTAKRVLKELVSQIQKNGRARSEDIANNLDLTIGCVNHHLRSFIDAGIIVRERARLRIRGGSLKRSIEELRRDAERMFEDMEKMAEELDREIGF